MAYTFTPTGQAAKFNFRYFGYPEGSSTRCYIVTGDSGARVPIYRSGDFGFAKGCKTIDLKSSSNAAYESLLDVAGADSLSILSTIQSHMSANNVQWYDSPGITTNTANHTVSANSGFCVSIQSDIVCFDMQDGSPSYRSYFKAVSGDKVILCIDANGKMGWIHISVTKNEVWLVSALGDGSDVFYEETEEPTLPTPIISPVSLLNGWLTGSWIAGQRGQPA